MSSAIPAPQRKWSDGDRLRVKAMLANGASASVIAAEMGLNRNQVIGRIHRDDEMVLRGKSCGPRTRPPVAFFMHQPRFNPPPRLVPIAARPVKAAPVVPPPPEHRMILASTGRLWCKWPVQVAPEELGGMFCCGDPVMAPGCPWCTFHHSRATLPPRSYPHG